LAQSFQFGVEGNDDLLIVWEDGERAFCRGHRLGADGNRSAVLAVLPAAEHPLPASLDRLTHECELRDELDGTWAARPLELRSERGRTMLVLEESAARFWPSRRGNRPGSLLCLSALDSRRLLHCHRTKRLILSVV
jgi:hypothetical protein